MEAAGAVRPPVDQRPARALPTSAFGLIHRIADMGARRS